MFFAVIFLSMSVFDVLFWRWADGRLRGLRRASLWRTLLELWMGWMAGYLLLACFFPQTIRRSDTPVPVPLHAAVYLWHLLVMPVVAAIGCLFSIVGVIRRISGGGRRGIPVTPLAVTVPLVAESAVSGERSAVSGVLSRRALLTGAAITLPPIVTMGAAGFSLGQLSMPPRVRRLELALPQLPVELDGMTIAQVTDLHVGKFTRPGMLRGMAEQVNQLRADFVLVTGDVIDMALADLPAGIDMLRGLDPRQGMYVVEGNHDLMEDPQEFEFRMRTSGLSFLADESRVATFRGREIEFLGLRWYRGDPLTFAAVRWLVRQRRNPDAFPILLAHHPHAFDAAAPAGIPLTLSGHTHGGQLMLTQNLGAGPLLFRYWSGVYRKPDAALVVSNGMGAWFPLRVNAPAEIIHLTLRSSKLA